MTNSLDGIVTVNVANTPNNDFDIFGRNEDVGTVEEDINIVGGTIILPSSAFVLSIVSSSIEDSGTGGINPEGTGIREVIITGVDANKNFQEVDLILDGTTAVTTTETWLRINRIVAKTLSVGSNLTAVGNIDGSLNGNIQSRIAIGTNETEQTNHTIPLDRFEKMTRFFLNSFGGKLVTARLLFKRIDDIFWYNLRTLQLMDEHLIIDIEKNIQAAVDVKWVSLVDVAGGTITAGFDFQFIGSKRSISILGPQKRMPF